MIVGSRGVRTRKIARALDDDVLDGRHLSTQRLREVSLQGGSVVAPVRIAIGASVEGEYGDALLLARKLRWVVVQGSNLWWEEGSAPRRRRPGFRRGLGFRRLRRWGDGVERFPVGGRYRQAPESGATDFSVVEAEHPFDETGDGRVYVERALTASEVSETRMLVIVERGSEGDVDLGDGAFHENAAARGVGVENTEALRSSPRLDTFEVGGVGAEKSFELLGIRISALAGKLGRKRLENSSALDDRRRVLPGVQTDLDPPGGLGRADESGASQRVAGAALDGE